MLRRGGRAAERLLRLLRGDAEPMPGDTVETVTLVFTDLEGFTRFTATRGDDAAHALLAEHDRRARETVTYWEGRVVKHLGDGHMLAFGERERAVRAALELAATAPAPLRLRAGVHTGEAIVTGGDVIGQAVNVAARVAALARGEQVLVTAETLDGIALPDVQISRGRRRTLKGVGDRVRVHRLHAQRASSTSTHRVPE